MNSPVRFGQFVDDAMGKALSGDRWLFRGHANVHWRVQSTYQRLLCRLGSSDNDLSLFANALAYFSSVARHHGLLQSNPDTLTLCSLARHHALPVPFVDWTLSPHVAAFFALRDRIGNRVSGNVRVFGMRMNGLVEGSAPGDLREWVGEKTFIYRPAHVGLTRATRQFSYLTFKWPPNDASEPEYHWNIEGGDWMQILEQLKLSGVGAANLLEGFDAVALESCAAMQRLLEDGHLPPG